jgi:UDP-GlcNAc:undecaprenyl-phosphate GlcNAc-1-phosphate transferase
LEKVDYGMNYFFIAIAFLVAVFMGWIITPQILLVAFRKRLFDSVGGRKTHNGIVPRLGGVVFVPVQCFLLVLSMFFMYKLEMTPHLQDPFIPFQFLLLIGLLILSMVGVIDDLIRIDYRRKFVAQIVASLFLPLSGLWINDLYGLLGITTLSPWIGMPLTVFVAVFIINAVNLIDGIDGLCSGLVGMGALVFGFLFIYNGAWLHAVFAFITAGVLCPFFYYNVFGKSKGRQRIFMGDTGSLTLGLSMAFLAISYAMNNPLIKPFSEGAIVVSFATLIVPLFDVVRVVWIRYRSHQPFFMPDQNHIHHKFLRMGLSHYATMALILALAFFLSFFNIIAVEYISNNIVIFIDIVLWVAFHLWLDRRELIRTKHGIVND